MVQGFPDEDAVGIPGGILWLGPPELSRLKFPWMGPLMESPGGLH
jgi:hypothetical protein